MDKIDVYEIPVIGNEESFENLVAPIVKRTPIIKMVEKIKKGKYGKSLIMKGICNFLTYVNCGVFPVKQSCSSSERPFLPHLDIDYCKLEKIVKKSNKSKNESGLKIKIIPKKDRN